MDIKHILILCVTCMSLLTPTLPSLADSPDDILVVANKSVKVNSITIDELAALFLKKRNTWKDGAKAVPLHAADNMLKAQFLSIIMGMSIREEKMYWEEQKIRHGANPPPEFSNALKAVFHLNGAVSYIYRAEFKENVSKVLLELPKK